jgi:hypothetical protein
MFVAVQQLIYSGHAERASKLSKVFFPTMGHYNFKKLRRPKLFLEKFAADRVNG